MGSVKNRMNPKTRRLCREIDKRIRILVSALYGKPLCICSTLKKMAAFMASPEGKAALERTIKEVEGLPNANTTHRKKSKARKPDKT